MVSFSSLSKAMESYALPVRRFLFKRCQSKFKALQIEENQDKLKEMQNEGKKTMKLYTLAKLDTNRNIKWEGIDFKHPTTFETLAMDPELKRTVVEDLDRFVKRKEFYQRVGRPWKRGYLLYGPPGTGKSSLIAAMANHLKFDVFDLQLTQLKTDMELRKVLLATTNKSILVIEDIDCSQPQPDGSIIFDLEGNKQLTVSGLQNFTDGLWSSYGEGRIIIFTTKLHRSKLDPALLRSGRMDMHIYMSYCTYEGFKMLARNYLGINEPHPAFEEIETQLTKRKVLPSRVAEELMKSEEAEVALQGLITFLKQNINQKKYENKKVDEDKIDHKKYENKKVGVGEDEVDHKLTYFI